MTEVNESMLDEIQWTPDGLVPVITQDAESGRVLMFAWMNREALKATMESRRAVYWSRSRDKLWPKGEESGHVQHVEDIRIDCDADVLLLVVKQVGGIACHTGRQSCFYRSLRSGVWEEVDKPLKNPDEIYQR